jgi:hypothetical protein
MTDAPVVADAPHGPAFERGLIALDENGTMVYRGLTLCRAYRDKLVVRAPAATPREARTAATDAAELQAALDAVRDLLAASAVFARLVRGHEYLLVLTDGPGGPERAHREVGPIC